MTYVDMLTLFLKQKVNNNIQYLWFAFYYFLKVDKYIVSWLFFAYAYYVHCIRKYKDKEHIKL